VKNKRWIADGPKSPAGLSPGGADSGLANDTSCDCYDNILGYLEVYGHGI